MEYYLIINERQSGPWKKENLAQLNVTEETKIWRAGLEEWVSAGTLEELNFLFCEEPETSVPPHYHPAEYYVILNDEEKGPFKISELKEMRLSRETLVWKEGMSEWKLAESQEDLKFLWEGKDAESKENTPGQENPTLIYYKSQWFQWAIIASAVNFFAMCFLGFPLIGLVLGLVAVYFSTDAKSKYIAGFPELAEKNEAQAKTLTIISLVIAGLSIIVLICVVGFLGVLFSALF